MATEEQWAKARAAWEAGGSYRDAQEAAGGSPGKSAISTRARAEGWSRVLVPGGEPVRADANIEHLQAQTARAREVGRAVSGLKLGERRGELVDALVDDAMRLRGQLFEPVIRKEVKVVPGGHGIGSDVEIVDVELPVMPPALQKDTALAFAIIVDKLLLLSGEATARTETVVDRSAVLARTKQLRDELEERRAAKAIEAGTG